MSSNSYGWRGSTFGYRLTDSEQGFTLIELLTAIVVLVIILTMLAQMLNITGQTISMNTHVLTSTHNNRSVLDVLSGDLDNIVINRNLPIFVQTTSNTYAGTTVQSCQLSFISRARGPSTVVPGANYRFMAVSYALSGNKLQRTYSPVLWTTSDLTSAVVNPTSSVTTVLAKNILSFEPSLLPGHDHGNASFYAPDVDGRNHQRPERPGHPPEFQ
jgi:prepilin-type N-terminal cleavage/methylation domain-containing protein